MIGDGTGIGFEDSIELLDDESEEEEKDEDEESEEEDSSEL